MGGIRGSADGCLCGMWRLKAGASCGWDAEDETRCAVQWRRWAAVRRTGTRKPGTRGMQLSLREGPGPPRSLRRLASSAFCRPSNSSGGGMSEGRNHSAAVSGSSTLAKTPWHLSQQLPPPPPAPPNPVHGQHPANRKDTMGIKEEQGYQRGVQYLTVGTKEGCRTWQ